MKKKVLMSQAKMLCILALLAIIGTSAVFAQRVGETIQVSGQTFTVESFTNGRLVMVLVPSLDGVWESSSGLTVITIRGSNGSLTVYNPPAGTLERDALTKGLIQIGGQWWRNFRSTGNLTWSYQAIEITFNTRTPNVAEGTRWSDGYTLTMSADGRTLSTDGGRTWAFTRR